MSGLEGRERFLSKRQIAEHSGFTPRWVELQMRKGLPSRLIGGRRRFLLSEVDEWLLMGMRSRPGGLKNGEGGPGAPLAAVRPLYLRGLLHAARFNRSRPWSEARECGAFSFRARSCSPGPPPLGVILTSAAAVVACPRGLARPAAPAPDALRAGEQARPLSRGDPGKRRERDHGCAVARAGGECPVNILAATLPSITPPRPTERHERARAGLSHRCHPTLVEKVRERGRSRPLFLHPARAPPREA